MSKSEAVARGASLTCAIFTGLQALALWMPAHRAVEDGGWGCLPGGSCPDRVEVHAAISHTSGELALALWGCFVAILVIHIARRHGRPAFGAAWIAFGALFTVDLLLTRDLVLAHLFSSTHDLIGTYVGLFSCLVGFVAGLTMAIARIRIEPVAARAVARYANR